LKRAWKTVTAASLQVEKRGMISGSKALSDNKIKIRVFDGCWTF